MVFDFAKYGFSCHTYSFRTRIKHISAQKAEVYSRQTCLSALHTGGSYRRYTSASALGHEVALGLPTWVSISLLYNKLRVNQLEILPVVAVIISCGGVGGGGGGGGGGRV